MTKAAFDKKVTLFTSTLYLKIEEETSKMLHLEHSFIWCRNSDASGSGTETPGKF